MSRPRSAKAKVLPVNETQGATPERKTSVKASLEATNPSAEPVKAISSKRQTNGAFTPVNGPITSASQLVRGKSVGKGSVGSFETLKEYTAYLRSLSVAELHNHSVIAAGITPIDDYERLIRRLETEWTGVIAREGRGRTIPQRTPFTPEQIAKQEAIRKKLLGQE